MTKNAIFAAIRYLFCSTFCPCRCKGRKEARLLVAFGKFSFTCLTYKGKFMATVPASGGPFVATIKDFIDDKGNLTTENDIPVWASSDDTIAMVVADALNPQSATVTLTGKTGQVQISADFPSAANGGTGPGYVVTGMLDVQPGDAVSASMNFAGPGV